MTTFSQVSFNVFFRVYVLYVTSCRFLCGQVKEGAEGLHFCTSTIARWQLKRGQART